MPHPPVSGRPVRIAAENRRARFNYVVDEVVEAGLVLTGSEVKSVRGGRASIAESYAECRGEEIWLVNCDIPPYLQAGAAAHEPKRPRKLLLQKRQIGRLLGAVERRGMTLIPLRLYFDGRGRLKVELALARGKQLHDKRESEKKRDWDRQKGRLLRAS